MSRMLLCPFFSFLLKKYYARDNKHVEKKVREDLITSKVKIKKNMDQKMDRS